MSSMWTYALVNHQHEQSGKEGAHCAELGWYLIDEENSGDQFSDSLVDVLVDDLVDFLS
jgi:hypothetical protein